MKTAIIKEGKILIEEVKEPSLISKGAIVKVLGCGLCGSDIVKYLEKNPSAVLGHEIVGEILKIDSGSDFKVGDKIVMGHHVPCFDCIFCRNKNYSMCEQFKSTNIFPAGFSEKVFVSELHLNNTVFKAPQSLSDVESSFLEPLACCVRAIERADLSDKSNVLVVGLGSIGLLMAQALREDGHNVIVCDLLADRLKIARSLGFSNVIKSEDEEPSAKKIKELTNNYGADAVFMTSGAGGALSFALKSIRLGGTILVFSSIKGDLGYANNEIYYKELKVLGSYSPAPKDLKTSLNLLAKNKVLVKNLSTVYNLNQLETAIGDTLNNKILKAYIKI